MGTLGELLDEALDFMNDSVPQPQGIVANTLAQPDIKSALLEMFLTKMTMPPEYGSPQESQDRKNDVVETQNEKQIELG